MFESLRNVLPSPPPAPHIYTQTQLDPFIQSMPANPHREYARNPFPSQYFGAQSTVLNLNANMSSHTWVRLSFTQGWAYLRPTVGPDSLGQWPNDEARIILPDTGGVQYSGCTLIPTQRLPGNLASDLAVRTMPPPPSHPGPRPLYSSPCQNL
jgi:hypothetical protein